MTATDELRRMLGERGIDVDASDNDNAVYWLCGKAEYEQYFDGSTRLIVYDAMPEQAIAATVPPDAASTYAALLQESAARMALQRDYNNQIKRIQNQRKQLAEMQAALERGKCHMVLKDDHEEYGEAFCVWWECDKCGCTMPNQFDTPEIHYCPSCGRRVVG